MPNGKPGDSIAHDILHLRLPVFGPEVDALIREISSRVGPDARAGFMTLVETWPWNADGTPHDTAALRRQLLELRDGLTTAPSPPRPELVDPAPLPTPPPLPVRRKGSLLAGLIGIVIGVVVGLPLGFLAWAVARESGLLPRVYWSSEKAMWAITLAGMTSCALLGLLQGARPTRLGHTLLIAVLGFFLGALLLGLLAGAVVLAIGTGSSEAGRADNPVVTALLATVPLTAAVGGLFGAAWTARRAWREWRG